MRILTGGKLVVATHNQGKLEEISKLLEPYDIDVVSARQLGLPEPVETESTFLCDARIKAQAAASAANLPALAVDLGVWVDVLSGALGVETEE